MGSHGQELLVRRVHHHLVPLSRFKQRGHPLRPIVVVENGDISIVVADGDMAVFGRVCDSSSLLLDRIGTERGGCRLDLVSLVWLSAHHIETPNFALSQDLLVLDADFKNGVVVTASQESSFLLNDLKTPGFTVVVRDVDQLLVSAVSVHSLDFAIVMSDEDLAIKDVQGRGEVVDFERDLSHELVLSSVAGED